MTSKTPGPAKAGTEGEYEAVGPAHIRPLSQNCNTDLYGDANTPIDERTNERLHWYGHPSTERCVHSNAHTTARFRSDASTFVNVYPHPYGNADVDSNSNSPGRDPDSVRAGTHSGADRDSSLSNGHP